MPSRRPHSKSRHGCERCKRRRIKCDEAGPPCGNCAARRTECQYSNIPLFQHSKWNSCTQQAPVSPPPQELSSSTIVRPGNDIKPNQPDRAPSDNRTRELQLMHQWCLKTCHSFSPVLSGVFQDDVVQQALRHPFLMDSLLALASLHVAHDLAWDNKKCGSTPQSTKEYVNDALQYQNRALLSFRRALEDVSPSNCEALFACSVIMMACAAVSPTFQPQCQSVPKDSPRSTLTEQSSLSLFYFVKGIHYIIDRAHVWLENSPFKDIITTHSEDELLAVPPEKNAITCRLKKICLNINPDIAPVYDRAICLLANCFTKSEIMAIHSWLLRGRNLSIWYRRVVWWHC